MLPDRIEDIEAQHIQDLIVNSVVESRSIEFKSQLPGSSDGERKDFLGDVSAFANASGGYIFYGIVEANGYAQSIKGVSCSDLDQEIRRIDEMLTSGVSPRIRHACRFVGTGTGQVLVIQISRSWNPPHMVIFRRHNKFYIRNSAGNSYMDVEQLRESFISGPRLNDKVEEFRMNRIAHISTGKSVVELTEGSKIILHLLPFEAFGTYLQYDVSRFGTGSGFQNFQPMQTSRTGARRTLDGNLAYTSYNGKIESYVHVYKNGIIEAVDCSTLSRLLNNAGPGQLPSTSVEKAVFSRMHGYLQLIKDFGIKGPLALGLTITSTANTVLTINQSFYFEEKHSHRSDNLIIPTTVISDLDQPADAILRPVFDMLWNAYGYEQSTNFDSHGIWNPN